MKQASISRLTLCFALLLLAVVVALLILLVTGLREDAGKARGGSETADTEPVREPPPALRPDRDRKELPLDSQGWGLQTPPLEKASSGIQADSDMPATDPTAQRVDKAEADTPEPYVGAASFRCVVPDGGAMLTGGWAVPNGGHAFALISPRPTPNSDGDALTVAALLFELPAEELVGPDGSSLLGPPQEGLSFRGASLSSDEVRDFRKAYASKMTRVMSAPSVTMMEGKYASMQMSGSSGGVMLGVIAERTADGSGIDVGVSVAEHNGLSKSGDTEEQD